MLYQNHQRIIFCRSPWIRFKSRIDPDQVVFWTCVIGGLFALTLPWGGQ